MMIFGMDQQGANSHNVCGLKCPQHGIFEKSCSDPLFLPLLVYGQSCEQHDRNGMMGESFRDSFWCLFILHRSHSQRVIADHRLISQSYIGG